MNVDEHTNNAIEIVSEGTKLTSQLILLVLKSVVNMLENDKDRDKLVINDSTKEGKQKINDLIKKHKGGIEALEGNLTKEQLNDYKKELKKLGVDFSIVKNGKDNYSFFFAGEQSNIIEKALKNVLEQKSQVLNNEKVKEAELDLNAEKYNFTEKEIEKIGKIYNESVDLSNEKLKLNEADVNNILKELDSKGFKRDLEKNELSVSDQGDKFKISINNLDQQGTYGVGDLTAIVDKTTGKADIYVKDIKSGDDWTTIDVKEASEIDFDLSILNDLDKEKTTEKEAVKGLSDKEKTLLNKIETLDRIEKEVQSKISNVFQDIKKEYEIDLDSTNNNNSIENKINELEDKIVDRIERHNVLSEESRFLSKEEVTKHYEPEFNKITSEINEFQKELNVLESIAIDSELSPKTKEESKEILHQKLSQLDNKQLDLFQKRMEYENLATSPVFDSTKTYLSANELTKMQKDFSKEEIQKINNLDREIRNLNNFDERTDNPKLTANEILKETKEFNKERQKENQKERESKSNVLNLKKYSIENVKKLDQEIKAEEKDKPVIRNKEQSL